MYTNTVHFRKMKKINIPIYAIDFEGSRKIGVVEYGVAKIVAGEVVAVETSLCAPKTKIPQRDADFFGIDNEQASKFPPFSQSVEKIRAMRQDGIFASHNAVVEDGLLRDVMASPAIVPDFANGGNTSMWAPWIDTCVLMKKLYPTLDSAKLSNVIDVFGLKEQLDTLAEKFCPPQRRKWHCAPYDALACAVLIIYICSQDGFENVSLQWLANYSSATQEEQTSLF